MPLVVEETGDVVEARPETDEEFKARLETELNKITPERQADLTDSDFLLHVLDFVLNEQLAGRRPNDLTVADHFGLTFWEAWFVHDQLTKAGEFD